jgi:hypothetical protein
MPFTSTVRTLLFLLLSLNPLMGQDHWETAVFEDAAWSYFIGLSEPDANWMAPDYNDSSWLQAPGGIGYGDGDDATEIPHTPSLYIRTRFMVLQPEVLEACLLHMDYDDGIIVYLNGSDIYRTSNLGPPGSFRAHDEGATDGHEANIYRGLPPEMLLLDQTTFPSLILPGENTLAVQIQNVSANSSDLTGRFWLSFGIADASIHFQPVPEWFFHPTIFTSSHLPIMLIDTEGQTIPDEPKIHSLMRLIDNGTDELNHVSDPATGYDGHVGIEVRGATSQMFPKKQYAMETRDAEGENLNVELLGFPEENDWIVHAPYSDKSLIRNALVYTLYRKMGNYASRTRFFELMLNDEYRGVYLLLEKIKKDNARIDIATLNQDEIAGDDLTGGYIIKIDKSAGADNVDWYSAADQEGYGGVWYQYHYPGPRDIVPEQVAYIQNFMNEFEARFADDSYTDPVNGYYNHIDWEQFIDYAIIQEFAKNVDGFRLSSFIYKDKDSNDPRLHVGPPWDFNLAFGNADYYDGANPIGWYFDTNFQGDHWAIPFWWYLIWEDDTFRQAFNARWQALRQTILSESALEVTIDSLIADIGPAVERNFERWDILDQYVWPNPYIGGSYENEVEYLKDWIDARLVWMDANTTDVSVWTPDEIAPLSVYPNPFNPNQTIQIQLDPGTQASIHIHDITGRLVRRLEGYAGGAGVLHLNWDGRDDQSQLMDSGVYVISVRSEFRQRAIKVTLLR